jgi:hypothetical protein
MLETWLHLICLGGGFEKKVPTFIETTVSDHGAKAPTRCRSWSVSFRISSVNMSAVSTKSGARIASDGPPRSAWSPGNAFRGRGHHNSRNTAVRSAAPRQAFDDPVQMSHVHDHACICDRTDPSSTPINCTPNQMAPGITIAETAPPAAHRGDPRPSAARLRGQSGLPSSIPQSVPSFIGPFGRDRRSARLAKSSASAGFRAPRRTSERLQRGVALRRNVALRSQTMPTNGPETRL